jgi:PhnB protein
MGSPVKAIPEGHHTITPHLIVRDASRAIEFYKQAFGAEEQVRMPGPGGKIMHASLKIGGSVLFLCDEFLEWGVRSPESLGGAGVSLHLYVENADQAFNRAVSAGAQVKMPLENMFWGDRYGKVTDPFGHEWAIATHIEDLTPEEIGKRGQAFFQAMGQGK